MSQVQALNYIDYGCTLEHFDGKRHSKQTGIDTNLVVYDGKPVIQLWPVNSRGNVGRCYLEVPRDKIDDLIDRLKDLQSQPVLVS